MRNNRNEDGNFTYKHLDLPISTKRKRRFVKWLERNNWELFCGYDQMIHLPDYRVRNTEGLYESFSIMKNYI